MREIIILTIFIMLGMVSLIGLTIITYNIIDKKYDIHPIFIYPICFGYILLGLCVSLLFIN